MTEDEAKTKACPYTYSGPTERANGGYLGGIEYIPGGFKFNCLGSACAAWEWLPRDPAHRGNPDGYCRRMGNP